MWGLSLGIHSFIYFNSGNKAHKTTDKRSDIKTHKYKKHRKTDREYTGKTVQTTEEYVSDSTVTGQIGCCTPPKKYYAKF